jgi:hypothetical protein
MMSSHEEEQQIRRAATLAQARDHAVAWAYWCYRGLLGERGGRWPQLNTGGMEKRYRAPPQWHPPGPRMPDADENLGIAVQRAFIRLPDSAPCHFRKILKAEYCVRPFIVALDQAELDNYIARKARVSIGAYDVTLDRALLALANVMKRMGSWKE